MRKKYLSALLFGALLFASAGTFTSCKDYDDDINGLREDVTSLQNAVTTLQNAVENGKYVSAVSNNGNTITFTFTDGTTTDITLEDEKGSVVTVNADGVLCIDGEPTDIKAATDPTPGEEQKDQIIIENNMWSVLQEDGTYKSTGIPVSGINVAGSEADGYTFTIYAADGSSQTVKLPSAASSITEMTLGREVSTYGESYTFGKTASSPGTPVKGGISDVLISHVEFDYENLGVNIKDFKASDWKGNKKLPSDGDFIYASPSKIDLRMDPVDVPANNIKFYLTNTKNENLQPVVLTASASQDSNDAPMGTEDINSRAAVTGNGLWTLSMPNQTVAKNDNGDVWDEIEDAETNGKSANPYVYALNANNAFRSEYKLTVKRIDPEELTNLALRGVDTNEDAQTFTAGVNGTYDTKNISSTSPTTATSFKVGVAYKVNAVEASALYDMYLTADDSDVKVYGLTFDQDAHTFTIGKNPDVSTVPANFDLIVETVANDGTVNRATITIQINTEISAATEYQLHTHAVNKKSEANHFGIDLSIMKNALGNNLDQWMQNVDLKFNKPGRTNYALYSNEACTNPVTMNGITAFVVEKLVDNGDAANTGDRNKTNYIQVNVNNDLIAQLELGKTYYFKASFFNEDDQILNSIVVPVTFTAPTLAEQFVKEPAVFVNGGNLAMAYMNVRDQLNTIPTPAVNTGKANYSLKNAFQSMPTDADVNANVQMSVVDNDKLYDGDYTSADLAQLDGPTLTENMKVSLKGDQNTGKLIMDDDTGRQLGYGQDLTIKATDELFGGVPTDNTGWKYADKDGEYTFQIRIMSPIYEGTVTAIGDVVEIEASDIVNGYKMGNEDIAGTTYNNIPYSVLPDKLGTGTGAGITTADWTREDIKGVSAKSLNTRVVTIGASKTESANAVGAEQDKDNKKVADGHILVFPENIAETSQATVNINVTDIWGYTKTNPITVQVNVGE